MREKTYGSHQMSYPIILNICIVFKAILTPKFVDSSMGKVFRDLNRIEDARACFQNVLILNHPEATAVKQWLQSN